MDKFVSKLSLYDILSMAIPGGTIFLFLSMTLGYKLKINESEIDSVLGWTMALVLSYLLGLINHTCTAMIWKRFRENHMLWREKECLTKKKTLITTLVIMILASIIKYICCFLSNFVGGIGFILLISMIFLCLIVNEVIRKDLNKDSVLEQLRKQYYKAYYYVMKHRYNDNIPIMEGQVAFIQNMTLPLALFLFFPPQYMLTYLTINKSDCCDVILYWVLFLILFVALISTAFCRQRKIVQLVWEDYEYLKQLEK